MIPIVGVTNNAGKNRFLFFMEHDQIEDFYVFEEANFLSQCCEIDIDVLETSHNDETGLSNYHLVSYDVLIRRELEFAQRLCMEAGHYPDMNELQLSRIVTKFCRLRVGEKGKKHKPFWVKRFIYPNNKHIKSRSHIYIYQIYCRVPEVKGLTKKVVSQSQILCVYYLKKKHTDRLLNKVLKFFKSDNRHNRKKEKIYKSPKQPFMLEE